jgi:subtilisin family serine protease
MDNVTTLKYGTASIQLKKSERLFAIRADENLESLSRSRHVSERDLLGNYVLLGVDSIDKTLAEEKELIEKIVPTNAPTDVYHSSDDMVPFVPTGTIYLKYEKNVPEISKSELLTRYNLALVRAESDGAVTLRVTQSDKDAVEVCVALQNDPMVSLAEPDLATEGELKHFSIPTDAFLAKQWHLQNVGQIGGGSSASKPGADARVVAAWLGMKSLGSPEVVIGIIDDGFDLTHPDLASRIVHPWDFKRGSSDVAPEPNLTAPATGDWHGTACAGVAVGASDAGKIIGAAPNCSWMPVRWSTLEPNEVVKWFDHLREKGASIISCSWSARARNYPLPTRIYNSIVRCANEGREGRGIVVVFAAGNENRDINDPSSQSVNGWAAHPNIIAVAASTSADERASYSNFGKEICLCAPSSGMGGWDVTTADVVGEFVDSTGVSRPAGFVPGDYNEHFGKTSSACPLVAGICGLILSVNPTLTAMQVRQILEKTGRRIGDANLYDINGHSKYFGYGCVDAEAAVAEASAPLNLV